MKTVEQRFWAKVNQDGPVPSHKPEIGACWIWTGAKNGKGRGKMGVNGKFVDAHKLAYLLFVGNVPDGTLVCHHCDNTSCVRDSHLFLGTAKDNSQDREAKGRGNRPTDKLSAAQVGEIKSRFQNGEKAALLAFEYGVLVRQIHRILAGQRSGNARRNLEEKLPFSPIGPNFAPFAASAGCL